MGVAVLAFARRTSPSRPRVGLVSDLEFSRSWGLGIVIPLRVARRLAFACRTRAVCAGVASLVHCVSRFIRPQVVAFGVLKDLGCRWSSWVLGFGQGLLVVDCFTTNFASPTARGTWHVRWLLYCAPRWALASTFIFARRL